MPQKKICWSASNLTILVRFSASSPTFTYAKVLELDLIPAKEDNVGIVVVVGCYSCCGWLFGCWICFCFCFCSCCGGWLLVGFSSVILPAGKLQNSCKTIHVSHLVILKKQFGSGFCREKKRLNL